MIYHILYVSEKSDLFQDGIDLEDILKKSRLKNRSRSITGILIKNGNFFIQLLEGKRETVSTAFDKISLDPRHQRVRTLITYYDSTRIFPNWEMGLAQEKDHALEISELVPLLHADLTRLRSSKDKIVSVLQKFNKIDEKGKPGP